MILGMSTALFTKMHVLISLIGIGSGVIVALGMLAGKLPAYGLGNPQNARIKRLTGASPVVVCRHARPTAWIGFLCHRGTPFRDAHESVGRRRFHTSCASSPSSDGNNAALIGSLRPGSSSRTRR